MRFLSSAVICLAGLAACSHQSEANTPDDPSSAYAQTGASQTEVATPSVANATTADGTTAAPAPQYRPAAAEAPANSRTTAEAPANSRTTPDPSPNPSNAESPRPKAPDNTATNKRDSDGAGLTPMDQRENPADLKVTQQIRQAVMANDSLSFTAKNVKIITINGNVTLRGPVNSSAERGAIEAAARRVSGVLSVDNQLEVKK